MEADGPDLEANLELLGNAGGEEADEGEKEVDVDEEEVEAVTGAAGASTGSEPASEADSAEKWPLTLNYLFKLSYIIIKIYTTGLVC